MTHRIAAGALAIVLTGMLFLAGVTAFGVMVDGIGERLEAQEICLRGATNGWEMKRCER
ncbi:MAG: hypothetical protein ACXWLZ_00905 [Rhizomicrobium sp.]